MDRAVALLRARFDEGVTTSDLVRETGLWSSTLFALLQGHGRVSPHAYATWLQIARALKASARGDEPRGRDARGGVLRSEPPRRPPSEARDDAGPGRARGEWRYSSSVLLILPARRRANLLPAVLRTEDLKTNDLSPDAYARYGGYLADIDAKDVEAFGSYLADGMRDDRENQPPVEDQGGDSRRPRSVTEPTFRSLTHDLLHIFGVRFRLRARGAERLRPPGRDER